jgi:hypothetical protein
MTPIPQEFIEKAREVLSTEHRRAAPGFSPSGHMYRSGRKDQTPEVIAVARLLRDITPRPLHELLAEDEAAANEAPAAPYKDETLDLLMRLREEVRDWQHALSGERDSLDALCREIDDHLIGTGVKN